VARTDTLTSTASGKAPLFEGTPNSRVIIEQARGVLAEHGEVAMDDAFRRVRSYARDATPFWRGWHATSSIGACLPTSSSPNGRWPGLQRSPTPARPARSPPDKLGRARPGLPSRGTIAGQFAQRGRAPDSGDSADT
jgi:ANTAR domain-containing protein